MKPWNRCDDCGRLIAMDDFGNGATHRLIYPDSAHTFETWETLCKKHAAPLSARRKPRTRPDHAADIDQERP